MGSVSNVLGTSDSNGIGIRVRILNSAKMPDTALFQEYVMQRLHATPVRSSPDDSQQSFTPVWYTSFAPQISGNTHIKPSTASQILISMHSPICLNPSYCPGRLLCGHDNQLAKQTLMVWCARKSLYVCIAQQGTARSLLHSDASSRPSVLVLCC